MCGAFNRFPDFFVQAFKIVVGNLLKAPCIYIYIYIYI